MYHAILCTFTGQGQRYTPCKAELSHIAPCLTCLLACSCSYEPGLTWNWSTFHMSTQRRRRAPCLFVDFFLPTDLHMVSQHVMTTQLSCRHAPNNSLREPHRLAGAVLHIVTTETFTKYVQLFILRQCACFIYILLTISIKLVYKSKLVRSSCCCVCTTQDAVLMPL